MTGITYDPILGPFDEPPKPQAGYVTIVMDGSQARNYSPGDYRKPAFSNLDLSLLTSHEKLVPYAIGGTALVAFLAWLSGLFFLFILVLIAIGVGVYFYLQQKVAEKHNGDPQFFQVDMSVHSIEQSRKIPIADTGFDSMVYITYAAKVLDAKGVVDAGVKDVRLKFSDMIYRQLVQHTHVALIDDGLKTFRNNLKNLGESLTGDSLVEMANVVFDARVENEPELRDLIRGRALNPQKITHDNAIRQAERDQHDYLTNEEEFFKEFMREGANHEHMIAAMNMRMQQQNSVSESYIKLLSNAKEAGLIDIEPHDLAKHFPELESTILENLKLGLQGAGANKALENKSDAPKIEDGNSVSEKADIDDETKINENDKPTPKAK